MKPKPTLSNRKVTLLASLSAVLSIGYAWGSDARPSPSPISVVTLPAQTAQSEQTPAPTSQPSPIASPSPIFAETAKPTAKAELKLESDDEPLHIDHIQGNVVHFKGGPRGPGGNETKPLTLDASELTPIGMLKAAPGGNPYFLVSGRPCKDCMADPMIMAFQANNPKLYKFVGPGRVIDHKTHAVVMESRAFYGHCLYRKRDDVYLVFQKERVDRKRAPQASVFIAEPSVDPVESGRPLEHLHEVLLERHEPRITDTFKLVHSKACHEIESHDRITTRHPIDMNLKRQKLMEEESDDETTKENQTDRDITPKAETEKETSQ